ncbi:hypothetical protein FC56_GL000430 [Lentilactobacillus senioris DSM 24302 = JCM 17472]|uniref:YbaK/aminoacyl-tRNA synthetase-associated domain-containing protein n=1 Tax=Lentilactobacillus senioris DSM 24302 = JCM 17472 TaxID=1423802 RepID=A0A0R2CPK8_9LACO|nr:hypothetical protein FC56_GL000430 [Lentilactobacillus senioris DSM 24302 = JCM 17472]
MKAGYKVNKQEVFDYLDSKNIWYEVTEHQAVYNMEEVAKLDVPYPTANAKNLFVRDGKKRNYYLITTKADKQLDLKEFRNHNNTKRLSFASPDELMQILGLIPGAVTPLGLLNPTESNIEFFIDEEFLSQPGIIGVHPNDNTATVWIKTQDLIQLIEDHGNSVHIINLEYK